MYHSGPGEYLTSATSRLHFHLSSASRLPSVESELLSNLVPGFTDALANSGHGDGFRQQKGKRKCMQCRALDS